MCFLGHLLGRGVVPLTPTVSFFFSQDGVFELFSGCLPRYYLPSCGWALISGKRPLLIKKESLLAGAALLDVKWAHILLPFCFVHFIIECLLGIGVFFLTRLIVVLFSGLAAATFGEHLLMWVRVNCSLLVLFQIRFFGALISRISATLLFLLKETSCLRGCLDFEHETRGRRLIICLLRRVIFIRLLGWLVLIALSFGFGDLVSDLLQ